MTPPPTLADDGAGTLDAVADTFRRHVAFPDSHAADLMALWCAHTWASSSFYVTPRVIVSSAEPGSGKTRVLEVAALFCHTPKLTANTSPAALFRRIAASAENGALPPTVLLDETDAVFGRGSTPGTEELRGMLNAGYKAGATIDRCEGDASKMTVREFPVFAPVMLAGIAGNMPDTITTRAVTIPLRKRKPTEHVEPFRERDASGRALPVRELLAAWVDKVTPTITTATPTMPKGVVDRPSEVWEALLAIADAAGGHWPDTARAACRYYVLEQKDSGDLSEGVELLRDIRDVFREKGVDRMHSEPLAAALRSLPEAPWKEPATLLDQRRLSTTLRRYSVTSRQLRIGHENKKGYTTDGDGGLADAWERYLPPS